MNTVRKIDEYGIDITKQAMEGIGLRTRSLENDVTGKKIKGTAVTLSLLKNNIPSDQRRMMRLKNEAEIKKKKKKDPLTCYVF